MKHQHYFKNVKHLDHIDVYRVLDLFCVTDPALAHAAKKILCAGIRGAKDQAKDVQEAIDTLLRWQDMQEENHIGEANEIVDGMIDSVKAGKASAWTDDKELPSSGIYGDNGYSAEDMKAASLVHDAEPPNPELVALCANTTIHADSDGWIEFYGKHCPVSNPYTAIDAKGVSGKENIKWENLNGLNADFFDWNGTAFKVTHWRYHKK